ncbi:hypothetical protein E1B28_004501 [Marasmius oreades]|uniref:DNA replication factor Cdt1 C-terminal domain-containing protein n=1 Tax=Marasmius oreades TaxID=181124 RepID=A0A9P8AD51_9AGAR|nr:uncharacterized protein E1B28_004501 [Marasmius oreades]KAG7097123.1 hypothetical protein E1B28_004501 [Marasmius oreades]
MSLYTDLTLSPKKKKRCPPDSDENTLSPKKMRIAPPTPPLSPQKGLSDEDLSLPAHLARLQTIQTALQHALSHALATCAVSPSSDTGIVRNVLNHISLGTYTGLPIQFTIQDLRRLCWLWEWDGATDPDTLKVDDDDENPFIESSGPPPPKDWSRGSMGFIVSAASHFSKGEAKRVPAYGIGIEVEMEDMEGGMAAVARWTAATESRRREFHDKLVAWNKMHSEAQNVPLVPFANLPKLSVPTKSSSLTRMFASVSPKSTSSRDKSEVLIPPSSPSRTPRGRSRLDDFAVPAPITPSSRSSSPSKRSAILSPMKRPIISTPSKREIIAFNKNTVLFPSTPSSHADNSVKLLPRTPTTSNASVDEMLSTPTESGTPQTPTTSRRQALYERIRQRSLSASPTKQRDGLTAKMSQDQMLKLSQDEMRQRCLLGRLGGMAESVWMLFNAPTGGTLSAPNIRKRRALPKVEVATAVTKSSPVPISAAEANESLDLLAKLCPFFLKPLNITGESWLEMPASKSDPTSPNKPGSASPGGKDSAQELVTRSPRRVKKEAGGLRDVREIIRRELELRD